LALQFSSGDLALCGWDGGAQNNDISIVYAVYGDGKTSVFIGRRRLPVF
jgi:hypothetical protein